MTHHMTTPPIYQQIPSADNSALVDYCWDKINNTKFPDGYIDAYFFKILSLNLQEIFPLSPILTKIHEIVPIKGMGIIRLRPDFYYEWHTDWDRGCGINMLLQGDDCACSFLIKPDIPVKPGNDSRLNKVTGDPRDYADVGDNAEQSELFKLDYILNELYGFNTQIQHCVMNWSGTRFMFSLEFHETMSHLPYRGLIKRLKKAKLL